MQNLLTDKKLVKVSDPTGAGTSDVTTDSVDMQGYEGVMFFSSYGTAATDNLPHLEQSSDDASSDSFADLEGTEVNVSTSDEDVWVEIWRPRERYVRAVFEVGTSSTLGDIWALLYGAKDIPVDNTTEGTIHGELHVHPAEGTI